MEDYEGRTRCQRCGCWIFNDHKCNSCGHPEGNPWPIPVKEEDHSTRCNRCGCWVFTDGKCNTCGHPKGEEWTSPVIGLGSDVAEDAPKPTPPDAPEPLDEP